MEPYTAGMAKKKNGDKGRDAARNDPTPKPATKSRLGRGLSSLMQVDAAPPPPPPDAPVRREVAPHEEPAAAQERLRDLPVEAIKPNPSQPRRTFDPTSLAELATSLKNTGVIQPLVVRADGAHFVLIAGERRLRAAKLAGLTTIPCLIRTATELEQAELALVENIQREDLNPIDRGEAYRTLQRQLGVSQRELAERLGEERGSISNFIRLLDLAEPVRDLVRAGDLPLGHAKVLAGVPEASEQVRLAELVRSQKLTVRNLERLIETGLAPSRQADASTDRESRARYLADLSDTLGEKIGTKCTVKAAGSSGYKLTLHLKNADQFDALMRRLDIKME